MDENNREELAPPRRPKRIQSPRLRPAHVIVLGFLGLIFLGAFLLCLPISSRARTWTPFLDALFTAASAVCVTGLVVVDTGTHFSMFGQVIVLLLIQAGGLGFMTLTTMVMLLLRRKITLKDRLVIQEALNQNENKGLVRLTRNILFVTLAIEGAGFLLLIPAFAIEHGGIGVWFAAFTAVSAFCNAGFDVLGSVSGAFTGLTGFASNVLLNLTVCMLIILGGLGFSVIMDIGKNKFNFRRLTFHSKIVLVFTGILILLGWVFFFAAEFNNTATMGNMSLGNKIMAGFFQSVTCRTAGFNTVNQNDLNSASKLVSMLLMFIGASPGSTGGGIKTTTLAILILMVIAGIKSDENVVVSKRTISYRNALKSVSVALVGLTLVFMVGLILLVSEHGHVPPDLLTLDNVLFETFSAFGTVGLSSGMTQFMSPIGKILLMLVMFFGRVGVITIGLMFMRKKPNDIRYPEGNIMIG